MTATQIAAKIKTLVQQWGTGEISHTEFSDGRKFLWDEARSLKIEFEVLDIVCNGENTKTLADK
jgi:hypothetical protein